ncbi:C-reactive protein-like isoform X2 [Pelobates fuscus]|uniref:C-reactive protein-like isoform X2 n=1 Tax=Pelobates fuscus TaxID=191477 RepID=UPI002FE4705F
MDGYMIFFIILTGAMAHQDLRDKVFVFPRQNDYSYFILKPEEPKPMRSFTVCLRSFTESTEYSLFSLATAREDNAILIYPMPGNVVYVYVGNEEIHFKVNEDLLKWKHICVSWESAMGMVQLWVEGKLYPRKVCNRGYSLPASTSIILGHKQDSYRKNVSKNHCFSGEIRDVHMWDYVLSSEKMQKVSLNEFNGNVLSWRSLKFQSQGNVIIEPNILSR